MSAKRKYLELASIVVLILISTLFDYILAGSNQYITILSPSIGIATTLFLVKGKKSFLPIVGTYFITLLVSRLFIVEEHFLFNLFLVSYKTVILIFIIVSLRYLLYKIKNNGYDHINLRDILNYIFIGTIITFLGSLFYLFPIYYFLDYSNELYWFGNAFIGHLFGFFIFGSSLNFSMVYDKFTAKSTKRITGFVLYIILSVIIMSALFSESLPYLSFGSYSYFLLLLYLAGVLYFDFIVVFILNNIMVVLYSIFLFNHNFILDLQHELFSILLVLITLTASSVLVRTFLLNLKIQELEKEQKNETLRGLMLATNEMFGNVDNIDSNIDRFSNNFLKRMFDVGCNVLPKFDMASCHVKNSEKVQYIDAVGYDIDYLNSLSFNTKDYYWSYSEPILLKTKATIYSSIFDDLDEYNSKYPIIKQAIRMTIFYDNQPVAGMSFDITNDETKFTEDDLLLFKEYQMLINSYYDISVLQANNNNLRNDIVKSLVRALGLYDHYTSLHSEEVAFLSLEISKRLKLGPIQTNRIYWSAVVHDIGKIGIKDTILNKVEPLTKDELTTIQEHAIHGYDILSKSKGLEEVASRVRHHHERWDGAGYPDQLKGKEIPLCSQILTVCDAVSAMMKDRSYSKAKTPDEIIGELYTQKGKQFSPSVANVMIDYIRETGLEKVYNLDLDL